MVHTILKKLDATAEWTGKIVRWGIVALVAVIIIETIARKVFDNPFIWSYETSFFIFGYYALLGSSYTLLHAGHVGIDVLPERLPEKWRHILAIVCFIILTGLFTVGMMIGGIPIAIKSWQIMEQGHSVWRPNIAHFRTVIPVAFGLIFLQGVAWVIRHVNSLRQVNL